MDDCSPDNTPEVAQSFKDPRVRYIRNEPNLGHLRNYNKGIALSRGEYVWLISADDRLKRSYALERYVGALQAHPGVGYVISPGVEMENGVETRLGRYSVQAQCDTVFKGHDFLRKLLSSNSVVAAAGMVRRSCYEKWGAFPLDMPYAGDWYLWCIFALHSDVAYLAEPMVNYRGHERSMTNSLLATDIRICAADDVAVLWRVKQQAEHAGYAKIVRQSRHAIAYNYARQITGTRFRHSRYRLSLDEVASSLIDYASTERELRWMQSRVYAAVGDRYFSEGRLNEVADFYERALREDPGMLKVWIKKMLLSTGAAGVTFRHGLGDLRKILAR